MLNGLSVSLTPLSYGHKDTVFLTTAKIVLYLSQAKRQIVSRRSEMPANSLNVTIINSQLSIYKNAQIKPDDEDEVFADKSCG
jgi:hypothetical protein